MSALGPRYWRLFTANAITNLGDGVGRICFPLLAVTLTTEPLLIAGVSIATMLPWLVFGLMAGVLVDRVDRRHAIVVANLARAVLIGGFAVAVAFDAASIWLLYAVAFVVGAAETVADSASHAMLPAVVRGDQLERGNGPLQIAEVVGNSFVGAPIGAALITVVAFAPFAINSVAFVVAAVVIAGIAGTFTPVRADATPTTVWRDVRDGVTWLVRHRLFRALVVALTVLAMSNEFATALLVLFAIQELGLGTAAVGLFVLAAGVGGAVGGLVAPWLVARTSRVVVYPASVVAGGACYLGIGLFAHPVLSMVLFGLFGATVIIGNVVMMSLRQALIPAELFGRVQGAWRTAVWGGLPLGAFLGGVLASVLGLRGLFVASGLVMIAVAAVLWAILARGRREGALDPGGTPDVDGAAASGGAAASDPVDVTSSR